MDKKYYRAKELAEYLGVGESTIWKKEQGDPEFPRRIEVSPHVTVWNIQDVDEYMARKAMKPEAEA